MRSVLIVDDIAENRYFLEVLLKGSGFAVRSAANGAEALESARSVPPDLIVSDILMPVMDGYTFCRECKADERLKRIAFIFYTATYTEKKDQELALSLGADRFVIKPQEPEELLSLIQDLLTGSREGGDTSPRKNPTGVKGCSRSTVRCCSISWNRRWPNWSRPTGSWSRK